MCTSLALCLAATVVPAAGYAHGVQGSAGDPLAQWLSELQLSLPNQTVGGTGSHELTLYGLECRQLGVLQVSAAPSPHPRSLHVSIAGVSASCQGHWRTKTEETGGTVLLRLADAGADFFLTLAERARGRASTATLSSVATIVNVSNVQWRCAPKKGGGRPALCDDVLDWLSKKATPLVEKALQDFGDLALKLELQKVLDVALAWFEDAAGAFLPSGPSGNTVVPIGVAADVSNMFELPAPTGADDDMLDWRRFRLLSLVEFLTNTFLGPGGLNGLVGPGALSLPSGLLAALPTVSVPLETLGSTSVELHSVELGGLDTLETLSLLVPGPNLTLASSVAARQMSLRSTVQLHLALNQSGDLRGPPLSVALDAGLRLPSAWALAFVLRVGIKRSEALALNLNQLTTPGCLLPLVHELGLPHWTSRAQGILR